MRKLQPMNPENMGCDWGVQLAKGKWLINQSNQIKLNQSNQINQIKSNQINQSVNQSNHPESIYIYIFINIVTSFDE